MQGGGLNSLFGIRQGRDGQPGMGGRRVAQGRAAHGGVVVLRCQAGAAGVLGAQRRHGGSAQGGFGCRQQRIDMRLKGGWIGLGQRA